MKQRMAISAGIICLIVFAFACLKLYSGTQTAEREKATAEPIQSSFLEDSEEEKDPVPIADTGTPDPYTSPIDFESLQTENPDIRAWLEVPETNISYPVLFRADDNSYYLTRNFAGERSSEGALFIEDYNNPDFSDPVTIIYGHNMKSKTMFGALQQYYSDGEWFSEHQTIYLYLPDRTVTYAVFAAVPFSNQHVLYYYNFSIERQFDQFFDGIYSVRSLTANFNSANNPSCGDHVLILSTCLNGDRTQRYLVLAKESNEEE